MKFLYALLFAVALVAADDAVTIKQFNDCKDENVAPGCPDGDTVNIINIINLTIIIIIF